MTEEWLLLLKQPDYLFNLKDTLLYITSGTKKQAEGLRNLVWSTTFPVILLPHRQLLVLYRRFCDPVTLSLMKTGYFEFFWLPPQMSAVSLSRMLAFLCLPMSVKCPYIWRMQNAISALHIPCVCSIIKCMNYLSFTKWFYQTTLVLAIIGLPYISRNIWLLTTRSYW